MVSTDDAETSGNGFDRTEKGSKARNNNFSKSVDVSVRGDQTAIVQNNSPLKDTPCGDFFKETLTAYKIEVIHEPNGSSENQFFNFSNQTHYQLHWYVKIVDLDKRKLRIILILFHD